MQVHCVQQSNLYSPYCAAAVTSVGRWAIAAVEGICSLLGWLTVYGVFSLPVTWGTGGSGARRVRIQGSLYKKTHPLLLINYKGMVKIETKVAGWFC